MGSLAWSPSPPCYKVQLTHYNCKGRDIELSACSLSWASHHAQLTNYDCQCRLTMGIGSSTSLLSPTCQNKQLTSYDSRRGWWWMDLGSSAWWLSLTSTMHNSLSMVATVGWKMDIGPSAWSLLPTYHHAQLTFYYFQGMKNRHRIISIITVTNILQCTTYLLRLQEQDEEWVSNNEHDYYCIYNLPQCRTHFLWLPER